MIRTASLSQHYGTYGGGGRKVSDNRLNFGHFLGLPFPRLVNKIHHRFSVILGQATKSTSPCLMFGTPGAGVTRKFGIQTVTVGVDSPRFLYRE